MPATAPATAPSSAAGPPRSGQCAASAATAGVAADENLVVTVTEQSAQGTSHTVNRRAPHGTHELLVRSRSELAGLDVLYHLLAPGLLRWLRARVADSDVATDLLAETFAQVVCSVERYRGETDESATSWVWAIARNLLRRYYRRQRVETAARQRLGVEPSGVVVPGPGEEARGVDVGEELRAALDGLPVRTRESVWLRVVDDLPY
jgi:RNA polymerase sigma factor (sigma-70 family)